MANLEGPKYRCKLCSKTHTMWESCRISAAPYYSWGYDWLGTPGKSHEICWVVPVANRAECDQVSRYFYKGWDLRCTGGGPESPLNPAKTKPSRDYQFLITVYRWVPDIVQDLKNWKAMGEPTLAVMFPPDEEEEDA